MDKNILKEKLEDVKAKIKANSKDAHYADSLISSLLSLKGQIEHEPTIAYVPLKDVVDQLDDDTYKMVVTKSGVAVFHVYGGYTVIADPRMVSLNHAIRYYIEKNKTKDELTAEEAVDAELDLSAARFLLSAPMYAFADDGLRYSIATDIIKWINSTADELMNQPLQDEDAEADAKFEDGAKAASLMSDMLQDSPKS